MVPLPDNHFFLFHSSFSNLTVSSGVERKSDSWSVRDVSYQTRFSFSTTRLPPETDSASADQTWRYHYQKMTTVKGEYHKFVSADPTYRHLSKNLIFWGCNTKYLRNLIWKTNGRESNGCDEAGFFVPSEKQKERLPNRLCGRIEPDNFELMNTWDCSQRNEPRIPECTGEFSRRLTCRVPECQSSKTGIFFSKNYHSFLLYFWNPWTFLGHSDSFCPSLIVPVWENTVWKF